MTLLRWIKVTGQSLEPSYREGDYVLVSSIPFLFDRLRPGDVIVFHQPLYGIMIKKIDRLEAAGQVIYVSGTHLLSVDSRQFGPIPRQDVLGKVLWHIRRK